MLDDNKVKDALDVLSKAIQEDDAYAIGWQANITMLMVDAGVEHKLANTRAGEFINRVFGRNTAGLT